MRLIIETGNSLNVRSDLRAKRDNKQTRERKKNRRETHRQIRVGMGQIDGYAASISTVSVAADSFSVWC